MKTITIDFTKNPFEISDTVLGHRGEKNATKLIITPPTSMSAPDSGVVYYCVAFQIGAHRVSHSELYPKEETITVSLERSVTQVNALSLQLEGYDGEENIIIKSDMVDNLTFDESIDGEEYDCTGVSNLGAEVAAMQTKLNKFGEDEKGNLIYNGKPISSSSAIKTVSIDINGFSDTGIDNGYWLTAGENAFLLFIDGDLLPENAEIVEMKMQLGNDVQIRSKADLYYLNYISTGTVLDVFARGQKISSTMGYFENETIVAYLGDPFSMSAIIEEVSSQNPMQAVIYYKEG